MVRVLHGRLSSESHPLMHTHGRCQLSFRGLSAELIVYIIGFTDRVRVRMMSVTCTGLQSLSEHRFPFDRILSIACGGYVSACIANGKAVRWGVPRSHLRADDNLGATGMTTPHYFETQNQHTSFIQISQGVDHTAAITVDGQLYCWGSNRHMKLGYYLDWSSMTSVTGFHEKPLETHVYEDESLHYFRTLHYSYDLHGSIGYVIGISQETPAPMQWLEHAVKLQVLQVSAGDHHTLCLVSNSAVYSWGCNDYGQLGVGSNVNYHHPVRVRTESGILEDRNVIQVCGGAVSCAPLEL